MAWEDERGSDDDIYAQRVYANGSKWGVANGVGICTASGNQEEPDIDSDAACGAIITWTDRRGANANIFVQRVSSLAARMWTADGVPICTAGDDQWSPAVTQSGLGNVIISWTDFRSGMNTDIYAQRIEAPGHTPGPVPISPLAVGVVAVALLALGVVALSRRRLVKQVSQ